MGGQNLGEATGHIKAITSFHFHIKGRSKLKACWADMPCVCWGEHCYCTYWTLYPHLTYMTCIDWILIAVASILCTLFLVILILLIAIAAKYKLFSNTSSKLSKQPPMISHLTDGTVHAHSLEVVVEYTSSQESGKLLVGSSSGQESHVSTPTSVESTTPLFKDHSDSSSQGMD